MPINPDAVGSTSEPVERSWTSKEALLYAVGVGAGLDELAFTTENSRGIDQQVLPTFAVIAGAGGNALAEIGDFNFTMLVHGEQAITVHKPIPVAGTVRTVSKVSAIWDKGSGAVIEMESESVDTTTGEPQFTNRSAVFIRGEGGWGGDRGPSGGRNAAPERAPDHVVSYDTRPDQALTYRLSGDRNPLHSDPEVAKLAGFEKPILHGLCTYGFTGRALLHTLCGSDPARFGSMEGRFSRPVYPGDTLTVSMWVTANEAVFQTRTQRDEVVIDGGRCTFA
ncbi:MAG: MaoC family dehydratase N-terminal domain-containing protein [Actinobacteria bacterium]|nr:MaoC family dehydratase N-terminal domain-containing protein [Actinomycetota bacterium]